MSDDDGCDADHDGVHVFTAAAAELLQQYSEYDTVINTDPISDVDLDSD